MTTHIPVTSSVDLPASNARFLGQNLSEPAVQDLVWAVLSADIDLSVVISEGIKSVIADRVTADITGLPCGEDDRFIEQTDVLMKAVGFKFGI